MYLKSILFIATVICLSSCSEDKTVYADYHNKLVNAHNDLKITYEELVDDFGWIITTDTSEKSRREFNRDYKTKLREFKRELINLNEIEEDQESQFRQSILDLTEFIIVYSDSLSIAAESLVVGEKPQFNFESFDTEVVNKFQQVEASRDKFVEGVELFEQ